ncbi:MAG: hypothetical protein J6P56_10825 [Bacteroidales bacterium]|nr:hypothetical protein [Bacteroidales bacterium]
MKNEVFNGQRFWSYFKYDFTQMWRNHVKASIGIGLSGLIVYIIIVAFNLIFQGSWNGASLGVRFATFFIAGTALELYQTRTYGYLTDKRKGSAWLMNPASTFEKWLSMILMTVVVLPLLFLGVYLVTDLLIASFDPTVGHSILHSMGTGFRDLTSQLSDVNVDYETTWSIWTFAPTLICGLVSNFLFFLLCGLIFKKNKILGGFVIIFLASALFSVITSVLGLPNSVNVEVEDFAQAEAYVRQVINTTTWISAIIGAGLAGGIYWRLKTLKH